VNEFIVLSEELRWSGCAKKQIAAGTYCQGIFLYEVNTCTFDGDVCPRLEMPTGQGYELCHATHAEARLAARMKREGIVSDGVAWVFGHYYACEPCAAALKSVGVTEIRVREVAE
jgi:deoxycytidylate deaminase